MQNINNIDPSLLQAMRAAIKNIDRQSAEELANNIKKHKDGPISTAMKELSGFATLDFTERK